MPRFSWELTSAAANGSNEALGDIFGLGKQKPPAPWDSKDPILVNPSNPQVSFAVRLSRLASFA